MRRIVLFVVALASIGMVGPARAASVSGNAGMQQALYFSFYQPLVGGGAQQGDLFVTNLDGASTNGAGVTPATTYTAQGDELVCDTNNTCIYKTFPQQQVSPTAFSMDPAGNSGTFTACLIAQSASSCDSFALSFARPTGIGYCSCVAPNGWVDPSSGSAKGTASSYVSVYRNGYTYSGTFAGASLDPTFAFDQYTTYLPAGVSVLAP